MARAAKRLGILRFPCFSAKTKERGPGTISSTYSPLVRSFIIGLTLEGTDSSRGQKTKIQTHKRNAWQIPNLVVLNPACLRSFAPLCALLRSFACVCALFCAHLRSFALICVFLRTTAFRNCRNTAFTQTFLKSYRVNFCLL